MSKHFVLSGTGKKFQFFGFILLFWYILPLQTTAAEYTLKTIPNIHLTDRYNYVSNPDGIINSRDVAVINNLLRNLEDSLSIEVAVVAVGSIGNNDARMFATDLFKQWGIGKKGEDNGLLIQLITGSDQRSVVFETGYGLEGVLPDAICYRLQQRYMLPDMREGDYSSGMRKGVEAVVDYLKASDYERRNMVNNNNAEEDIPVWMLFAFIFLIPVAIMLFSFLAYQRKHRKRKCPRCGKKTFAFSRTQTVQAATYHNSGIAEDIYICSNCGYTERKRKHIDRLRSGGSGPVIFGGGRGFGGGSRGGFGGGGGSWGGGRSGGGGSISRF